MSARTRLSQFGRQEDGAITVLALYLFLTVLLIGGLSIDYNKLNAERAKLQATADSVAHAALVDRRFADGPSEAKDTALVIAATMLPAGYYGNALQETDIQFGIWDEDTLTFAADNDSKDAVQVDASQLASRDNSISNYLLHMVGVDAFDAVETAVFATFLDPCFVNGFAANGVVDVQSNNSYFDQFCIHSNSYVKLNLNNYFGPEVKVSMPDLAKLELPESGMENNEGLADALYEGSRPLPVIDQLEEIIADLALVQGDYLPDYITATAPNVVTGVKKITMADLQKNAVNIVSCTGSKMTLDNDIYSEVVIVTDCEISFGGTAAVEDAIVATTHTGSMSLNSSASFRIGKDDNCAKGGGASLLTLGSFSSSADMQVYGSQIIAKQNIDFAANATGVEGASLIAGGDIDSTSNMSMGFCPGEPDDGSIIVKSVRMVL